MNNKENFRVHTFHIPVMGTGFTIDTPLKVARYGISSVISLLDDVLIEQMRKFHSQRNNIPYKAIKNSEPDARARRITAYLDLMDDLINEQIQNLKNSLFEDGTELTRYFRLLPEGELKSLYLEMLNETDESRKKALQDELRDRVIAGNIDVNIMTKCDRDKYQNGEKLSPEFADAMSALRGFAKSKVSSSVVFSAGMNPRLYSYISEFEDFKPDGSGNLKKKITLKVSDYRSADIQGKFLAKKGLWVSEYRVESGLNCGGHAFAGKGNLIGITLEEFKSRKKELIESLYDLYEKNLIKSGISIPASPPEVKLTVQGGIGTVEENRMLFEKYGVDRTGWGTPFLLVPETVNIDDHHLEKLRRAGRRQIFLSDSSPLGVPFWNLKKSASELARRYRIKKGRPGSVCPKGYPAFNSEFTDQPICTASREYQALKLQDLRNRVGLRRRLLRAAIKQTLQKSCLCHDLAGSVSLTTGIAKNVTPAITTGPNIVNFNKIATLEQMIDHIYGRGNLICHRRRIHMFIAELNLNIEKLKRDIKLYKKGLMPEAQKQIAEYKKNIEDGIEYYRNAAREYMDRNREQFIAKLEKLNHTLNQLEKMMQTA
ncbi:MAG: hypothetical protein JW737_10095 [Acidobacteria bacterium]|nr:hypothetical protein [Acidobacteriota bacterium]